MSPPKASLLTLAVLAGCGGGTAPYCLATHLTLPAHTGSGLVNLTLTKPGDPSPLTSFIQDPLPNQVFQACATKLDDGVEPGWTLTAWTEPTPTDGGLGSCDASPFTCAPAPGQPALTRSIDLAPGLPVVLDLALP